MALNSNQIAIACGASQSVAAQWLVPIASAFAKFEFHPLEQAAFLAQVGYESIGLTRTDENLNYSSERLLAVFPSYFDHDSALQYQGKPAAIANHVYANRFGNRDESSGDGWRYRGRALIQITFHDNYLMVEDRLGIPCVDNPDLLMTKQNAVEASIAFWIKNDCKNPAIFQDIDTITKKISGSLKTADVRRVRYEGALKALDI